MPSVRQVEVRMLEACDLRKDVPALVTERNELRNLVDRMLPYLTPPQSTDADDEARYMQLRRELCALYRRDESARRA